MVLEVATYESKVSSCLIYCLVRISGREFFLAGGGGCLLVAMAILIDGVWVTLQVPNKVTYDKGMKYQGNHVCPKYKYVI